MTRVRWLALLVVPMVLAGCGGGDDLPAMSQKDATTKVENYAGITLAASGIAVFSESAANVTGCPRDNGRGISDPDDMFYVQGIYRLTVPAGQEAATLEKVRGEWQRNGYTLESAGTSAEVGATTGDTYRLELSAGQPPGVLLLISSPCYRPD